MKNQFETLQFWLPQVLAVIRKDIKTDHLGSDPVFYKSYFGNRPQNRLTADEITAAYEKELLKGNEGLGEWVVNRWVFKHGDLYSHFAERLSAIHTDFAQIQQLNEAESEEILRGATAAFGAVPVYLFSVLNGVVFPETVLERLSKEADLEFKAQKLEEASQEEKQSLDQVIARHQREMNRLNEKYENRLAGIQKKYATDTEALKKQVRSLQQKLQVLTGN
jgi:hypothetical protein